VHGATRGIAGRIAARLRAHGLEADVRPAGDVTTLDDYDAVVLGCPVYDQRWPADGETFARDRLTDPSLRVWVFSVGAFGDDRRLLGRAVRHEPRHIDSVLSAVGAHDYRVFAGRVERGDWPWASRLLYRLLGGHLGDGRDREAIDAWADRIAAELGPLTRADPGARTRPPRSR
jgi:menaquinone-dependent protoporphyrinogen oxidase